MKRTFVFILLLLVLALSLSACGSRSDMPFNGQANFHEITLTIPDSFIRDSTESTEDLWLFEKGLYSQYIILSRQDSDNDPAAVMDSYAAYMTQQGCRVLRGTFLELEAVKCSWTRDNLFCQELLFAYNGSLYAVSLRGGSEAAFDAILDTIELTAGSQTP